MKEASEFISVTELARRRGLSRHVIYEKIKAGEIATDSSGRPLRAPFETALAALNQLSEVRDDN